MYSRNSDPGGSLLVSRLSSPPPCPLRFVPCIIVSREAFSTFFPRRLAPTSNATTNKQILRQEGCRQDRQGERSPSTAVSPSLPTNPTPSLMRTSASCCERPVAVATSMTMVANSCKRRHKTKTKTKICGHEQGAAVFSSILV